MPNRKILREVVAIHAAAVWIVPGVCVMARAVRGLDMGAKRGPLGLH